MADIKKAAEKELLFSALNRNITENWPISKTKVTAASSIQCILLASISDFLEWAHVRLCGMALNN